MFNCLEFILNYESLLPLPETSDAILPDTELNKYWI